MDGVLDPGKSVGPDPRMDQVIQAVSGLTKQVSQLADQVGGGDPGQAGAPREVGAAGRPLAEQLLEQQGPVVAARVLLEELAAGPERAAHRGGR